MFVVPTGLTEGKIGFPLVWLSPSLRKRTAVTRIIRLYHCRGASTSGDTREG